MLNIQLQIYKRCMRGEKTLNECEVSNLITKWYSLDTPQLLLHLLRNYHMSLLDENWKWREGGLWHKIWPANNEPNGPLKYIIKYIAMVFVFRNGGHYIVEEQGHLRHVWISIFEFSYWKKRKQIIMSISSPR